MKVAVLGAGFGLYGYLPALTLCGQQVVLPERYRARLAARQDVGRFETRVEWVGDDEAALAAAPAVVVTRRPADQVAFASLVDIANVERVLLEKPLAPNPRLARGIMSAMRRSGVMLRIGYLFRYAPWAETLRHEAATCGNRGITLRWRFRAHHYMHDQATWKRSVACGGGALRFYGIHVIAVLAEIGYEEVLSSMCVSRGLDEAEAWRGRFRGTGLADIQVEVDSNSDETSFSIACDGVDEPACVLPHPFFDAGVSEAGLDGRVAVLLPLCRELVGLDLSTPPWYDLALALWEAVEQVNVSHVSR